MWVVCWWLGATGAVAIGGLASDECLARARAPLTRSLEECMNLAPPFTGSRSLTNMMRLYAPSYVHHDHRITVALVKAADFNATAAAPSSWLAPFVGKGLARPTCFVMPLRDPAARVHSAISQCRNGRNCFSRNRHRCQEFALWNRSSDDILAAFFDRGSAEHALANEHVCWGMGQSTTSTLAGLDCAEDEVHYLCTDRLLDDFAALVKALGEDAAKLEASEANFRVTHRPNTSLAPQRAAYATRIAPWYASQLSDANKARVRSELFAEDAALYRAHCGPFPP